jgi:MFS family permease
MPSRLLTPRFLLMFGYSFTVFVSVFQLTPTAPYRVLDLGGSTAAAGLFLGLLTFASAASAPVTGPLSDRLGHRVVLIATSLALAVFTSSYAFIQHYQILLVVVVLHGLFWSALLSASGAYMLATIPDGRRGEGLGYWGLASVLAMGAAPALGFWVYRHGWTMLCLELTVLNLTMAAIAWVLPDDRADAARASAEIGPPDATKRTLGGLLGAYVEWRVLLLSITTALVSFGYGGLTSFAALFADELAVAPRSVFLTGMAAATLIGRLTIGRSLDRLGHRRVLTRCLLLPPVGLLLLSTASGRETFVLAALVFGAGFGLMHPAFTAFVMGHVTPRRRGAAFGAMLASFDTGIGAGSSIIGSVVHAHGYRVGFGVAACVAAMSVPYFLVAARRLGFATD